MGFLYFTNLIQPRNYRDYKDTRKYRIKPTFQVSKFPENQLKKPKISSNSNQQAKDYEETNLIGVAPTTRAEP